MTDNTQFITPDDKAIALVEANAPVIGGALPRTTSTLKYIPPERHPCYGRAMDGNFALRFLYSDDEKSFHEYSADVATGKLSVRAPGTTPELDAKRQAEAEAKSQAVLDKVNRDDAVAREARNKAAYDREQAALKTRFGR